MYQQILPEMNDLTEKNSEEEENFEEVEDESGIQKNRIKKFFQIMKKNINLYK